MNLSQVSSFYGCWLRAQMIVTASGFMVQDLHVSSATKKNANMELNPSHQDYEFVLRMGHMLPDTQML